MITASRAWASIASNVQRRQGPPGPHLVLIQSCQTLAGLEGLHFDAIVHQATAAAVEVFLSDEDSAAGGGDARSAEALGVISYDPATDAVPPLRVELDDEAGGTRAGFIGMLTLGVSHIAEGTDHQLFLLTLLVPAPLAAAAGRWSSRASPAQAARRITATTAAFTVGHSLTLAIGALGLAVPQQPVEALIAVSILVAAAHALRPFFPGHEPVVAGGFGLVHGLAFSATLSALHLSGARLLTSLLGFNVGIELMQLVVVVVALPPLIVLARTRPYGVLRVVVAVLTAVAAVGWLLDRLGVHTPLATAADSVGPMTPWAATALWIAAGCVAASRARHPGMFVVPISSRTRRAPGHRGGGPRHVDRDCTSLRSGRVQAPRVPLIR